MSVQRWDAQFSDGAFDGMAPHDGHANGMWCRSEDVAELEAALAAKDERIAELEDWQVRACVILEEIKRREYAPHMDNSGTPFLPRPMPEGRRSSVEERRPAAWWDELNELRAALQPAAREGGE